MPPVVLCDDGNKRQIPVTDTQIQSYLRSYFKAQPAFGEEPRVEEFQRLTSGWASDVYSFTLRYEQADGNTIGQRLVMKAYQPTTDGMDRALKERHALYHLRTAKYPVPGVAAVEANADYLGQPFIVMEQIDGQLMADALDNADERERGELVALLVSLMTDLHDIDPKLLVPRLTPKSEFAFVRREIYVLRGLVQNYDRPEFTPVLDWLYEHHKEVPSDGPTITHRDFHPWNVILTNDGRPYVIDWGWQLSDKRYDLAWTLTLLERDGRQVLADDILAEYERATGAGIDGLDYFKVLATVRWLFDVTHSLKSGANLRSTAPGDTMPVQAEFRALITGSVRNAVDLIARETEIKLDVDALLS